MSRPDALDSTRPDPLPTASSANGAVRQKRTGVYVFPASLEQIRYWTLDQLDGASTASNMAIAARLEGVVDDAIVERAVRALVERHEALRTTFRMVDDRLCQIISEECQIQLRRHRPALSCRSRTRTGSRSRDRRA